MFSPVTICNYILKKSFDDGVEITPMKLIKLVYIAHGWTLALSDNPLITEQVEAWKFGPVINSVYRTFKKYGNRDIPSLELNSKESRDEYLSFLNSDYLAIVDKVWELYKGYTGIQLSSMTHRENTPWDIVWNKQGGRIRSSEIISNNIIKDYYSNKLSN